MRVAGVDVWKGQWVAIVLEDGQCADGVVAKSLDAMLDSLKGADAIGVDVPLWMPSDWVPRDADAAAREFVGPKRKNSVFSVYRREVYMADTHAAASTLNKNATGKGISKQSYDLGKRILEAD